MNSRTRLLATCRPTSPSKRMPPSIWVTATLRALSSTSVSLRGGVRVGGSTWRRMSAVATPQDSYRRRGTG
eukprot:16428865-Heterocapsa_arctica.AAC.1